LVIPVNIPEKLLEDEKDTQDIELAFTGPKGNTFGQSIILKVKRNEGTAEYELYKAALGLTECGMGTFDDCVEALRQCNNDENAAVELLLEKQSKNFEEKQ